MKASKGFMLAAALISVSLPTPATAELNYDAISLGYGTISESGWPDMTVYLFGITKSISNNAFVGASYERDTQPTGTGFGDITGSSFALDIGYHTPLKENTDLIFSGGLMNGSADFAGISASSNGYHLSAGIRAELAPKLVGEVGFGYANTNTSILGSTSTTTSTGLNASIGFRVTPELELIAAIGSATHTPQAGGSYSTSLLGFEAKIYY